MKWSQNIIRWYFYLAGKVVKVVVCDMDEADRLGLKMYHAGQCDSWGTHEVPP